VWLRTGNRQKSGKQCNATKSLGAEKQEKFADQWGKGVASGRTRQYREKKKKKKTPRTRKIMGGGTQDENLHFTLEHKKKRGSGKSITWFDKAPCFATIRTYQYLAKWEKRKLQNEKEEKKRPITSIEGRERSKSGLLHTRRDTEPGEVVIWKWG